MSDYQMGVIESQFADIIWDNQPMSSAELVRRSEELLKWKKSTTYTVLKRLCDKGIFQNDRGTVTAVISREDFYSEKSHQFVEQTFAGSLPAFLAAFTKKKKLTQEEVSQLRRMVAQYEEG